MEEVSMATFKRKAAMQVLTYTALGMASYAALLLISKLMVSALGPEASMVVLLIALIVGALYWMYRMRLDTLVSIHESEQRRKEFEEIQAREEAERQLRRQEREAARNTTGV